MLGTGSAWDDNELRYSLRSIEKYACGYGRIFISGPRLPGFINKDRVVWHKYNEDPANFSWKNVYYKIRAVCRETDISDNFILMMDDVFFTRPVDLSSYPVYYRRENDVTMQGFSYESANPWWKSRYDTYMTLRSLGYHHIRDYEVHSATEYNKQNFLSLDLSAYDRMPYFVQSRSFYYNRYHSPAERAEVDRKTNKSRGLSSLTSFAEQKEYFSIGDAVLTHGGKEYLKHKYPMRSRWELPDTPEPSVAIVAVAKNEDHYIDEWLDAHLKLGASHIYVYANNWNWKPAPRYTGMVTVIPWDRQFDPKIGGHLLQAEVYNDFIDRYHSVHDFAAFIDIDEYINIKTSPYLGSFLAGYADRSAIALHWRMFGSGGQHFNGVYRVLPRFPRCRAGLDSAIKTIVNLKRTGASFRFISAHTGYINGSPAVSMLSDRHILSTSNLVPYQGVNRELAIAYLNHYRVKTPEEFAEKIERNHHGLFQVSTQIGWNNVRRYDCSEVTDISLQNRLWR